MIALAFDTSGPVGSVAVLRTADGDSDCDSDGGAPATLLSSEVVSDGMRHGVDLFPAMERVLRQASVAPCDVGLVAVGTGPGSYTGLRVGVTAARAFAYACGARLLGVPSCDAWAHAAAAAAGDAPLAVVLDAKVRAVYIAMYRRDAATGTLVRTFGPELLPPEEAAALVPEGAHIVGDGVEPYAAAFGGRTATAPSDGTTARADAVLVGRLAVARARRGERDAIEDVVPLYLREFRPTTPKTSAPVRDLPEEPAK